MGDTCNKRKLMIRKGAILVHDSSGKWLGQYETEDAAVEMLREMAKDTGGYSDEI